MLENLPDIQFCDKDPTAIEQEVISAAEQALGRSLQAADPLRLLLLGLVSIITQQRNLIDYTGKQNLVAYAKGPNLDHLAILRGIERMPNENDNRLKERIIQAPDSYSVAGPIKAYRSLVLGAHLDIVDVSVRNTEPGVIEIRPLLKDGRLPDQPILDAVRAVLDPETAVPMTDHVIVDIPEVVLYDLELTYFTDKSSATLANQIQGQVSEAVQEYLRWQRERLGQNINPSRLTHLVMGAGASRIEVVTPNWQAIEPHQVAIEDAVMVNYGGLDE